jgi:uncharacterized protein
MKGQVREVLALRLEDAVTRELPRPTRRDVYLPKVPGKALAIIGMRRSGKTSYLWQLARERLEAGAPRESVVLLNFEDEQLLGVEPTDIGWLVEEHYRRFPHLRDSKRVTWFFDEIQLVPGWEVVVRRLIDSERVEIFVSGSSAKLLSREVATSMRGRGLEAIVFPFSFRESLRHAGEEPTQSWRRSPKAIRSRLANRLREYLTVGGFPEAQGLAERDRRYLLTNYVDTVLLRDVIDRHAVSNPTALRRLERHLMSNPAAPFSIQKCHDSFRSQGVAIAKDTLHQYLAHLEDAFLVRTVPILAASDRQRTVNPRKSYPIDPGFIPIYERVDRAYVGHALETIVLIELERRGYAVQYLRTKGGYEVDFHAECAGAPTLLVQVCAELGDTETREREVRALLDAKREHVKATALLITLDDDPPRLDRETAKAIEWQPAVDWLLSEP